MKYHITIEVLDEITYTINTASCEEHAGDIAIQMFKQDYPDLNFQIIDCISEEE